MPLSLRASEPPYLHIHTPTHAHTCLHTSTPPSLRASSISPCLHASIPPYLHTSIPQCFNASVSRWWAGNDTGLVIRARAECHLVEAAHEQGIDVHIFCMEGHGLDVPASAW